MAFRNRSKFHNVCSDQDIAHFYADVRPSRADNVHSITASTKNVAFVAETRNGASVGIVSHSKMGDREGATQYFHPHADQIYDIAFHPYDDSILATASGDRRIEFSRIPDEGLAEGETPEDLGTLSGHDHNVYAVRFHPSAANVVASASRDNTVKVWDVEARKCCATLELSDWVYDVSWKGDGSAVVASTRDKMVRIADPRSGTIASEVIAHPGTKPTRVQWLGNRERIVTTGFTKFRERQMAIWDTRDMSKALTTVSFDSAPGVLRPLYDEDADLMYLAGRGESTVRVFDVSKVNKPYQAEAITGKLVGKKAHQDVCLLPKRALDVLDCEVGRMLRLMDKTINVVHFRIKRQNKEFFADDLFPDTASAHNATAAEYFAGKNGVATKKSLNPEAA
eukprot:TRINITY_DN14836_c0_g1_i1.p1 TRINITY_DN14836_c0_g1~~TRINITY_DN14836_c0_g1_i1.p1  ORF type:complete len:395 (-),score=104.76 TRINITY_DN14836_c0_g1_i1:148-1332(-)